MESDPSGIQLLVHRARLGLASLSERTRWSGAIAKRIGFVVGLAVVTVIVFGHVLTGSRGEDIVSKVKVSM